MPTARSLRLRVALLETPSSLPPPDASNARECLQLRRARALALLPVVDRLARHADESREILRRQPEPLSLGGDAARAESNRCRMIRMRGRGRRRRTPAQTNELTPEGFDFSFKAGDRPAMRGARGLDRRDLRSDDLARDAGDLFSQDHVQVGHGTPKLSPKGGGYRAEPSSLLSCGDIESHRSKRGRQTARTPRATRGQGCRSMSKQNERAKSSRAGSYSEAARSTGMLVLALRRRLALSQTAFARKIGSTAQSVARLESGRTARGPTVERLERIAKACGAELEIRFRLPRRLK